MFRFLRFVLVAALSLAAIPVVFAQSSGTTTVNVAVYSAPKTFAPVFDSIPANTTLTVEARDLHSTWFFVRFGSQEGWIPASFINVFGAVPQGTASGFVNTDFLNVRWEPNFSRPAIKQLEEDDVVIVSGRDESGTWYFVQRPDNKFGWVSARYITVTAGNAAGIPVWRGVDAYVNDDPVDNPNDEAPGIIVMDVPVLVNIWSSATATQIGTVTTGTSVAVIAASNPGELFYLVRLPDGRLGWVRAIAVSVTEAVPQV